MVTQIRDKDALSRRALGQRLYEKNVALGNRIRKSVQGKLPTDLNVWQQMRDNFEAIILGDPPFSFKNNIEDALWRLHYQRIEAYRAYIRRSAIPAKSDVSDDSASAACIAKIHLEFKAFLSEASGFYHDLIEKIRDKYGLPNCFFYEEPFNQSFAEKDVKTYAEMRKGLVSWHRCLICLGDLARYKILHEVNESETRDYAEASGYYLQASSIWPSSGHPHHQLAIVASYSGEELVEVYWYFRSLAVEYPISTTRETLIVLFEKNRRNYLLLPDNRSSSTFKGPKLKVKGKFEARRQLKEKTKSDANFLKRTGINEVELFKHFCIRFVRLSGIIFTRLSLETFAEVLALVNASFEILLSHGPQEKRNFGKDGDENRLFIVRLVAILIFTVHNTKNATSKDQSHMQRQVFLQNACTAVFLLMGTVFKRCAELRDTCSSCLFPGILVFLEWLASCPDVASGTDADEDEAEANVRIIFWNQYVKFLNKLLSSGLLSIDAAENAFIDGTNTRDDGELRMHLSLWEDIELRGYLPLRSSQMNIQYARNAFGGDKLEEQKARVRRVLEASKVLAAVVKVNEKELYFDVEAKRFMIGTPIPAKNKSNSAGIAAGKDVPSRDIKSLKLSDEEEEDEVIVFKPNPLRLGTMVKSSSPPEGLAQNECYMGFTSKNHYQKDLSNQNGDPHPSVPLLNTAPHNVYPVHSSASNWALEQQTPAINDIIYLGFLEDEPVGQSGMIGCDNNCPLPSLMHNDLLVHPTVTDFSYDPEKHFNPAKSTMAGSAHPLGYSGKLEDSLLTPSHESSKMNPVRRPGRHHGPPPGFGIHPKKHVFETVCSEDATGKNGMLYSDSPTLMEYPSASTRLSMGWNASPQVGWRDQREQSQHVHQMHKGLSGLNDWHPF